MSAACTPEIRQGDYAKFLTLCITVDPLFYKKTLSWTLISPAELAE